MGKTFLTSNLNNDKVGDIYLVMYSNLKANTPRPSLSLSSGNMSKLPSSLLINGASIDTSSVSSLCSTISPLLTLNNSLSLGENGNDINFINGIHYTLVIDVGGESLTNVPVGLEIHITAEKGTNQIH
ncbi:hypothetical protein DICPUDRAFT_82004 [Dictyostelium purpureum]|uniref:Uncharacterized protein n=1 Tax=Dictyostelium purpureum TaxID=5786 RepID=F0ZV87_DICPU|nr:uncharacterized protein DICPUDRAFT_82004 [Dictyostelium purpureum]EGC32153.1 hypothetical protein DICPUDRAFT_82004 [Dictyostelium purpureum]|eukprot:XP_003291325.1 hypothetical protein DICPUDRAFT_82004 [Dictyostelium purpureum]